MSWSDGKRERATCDECGRVLWIEEVFEYENWDSIVTSMYYYASSDTDDEQELDTCPQCHVKLDEGTVTADSEK